MCTEQEEEDMKANAQLHKIREFGEEGLMTSDYCEWGGKEN